MVDAGGRKAGNDKNYEFRLWDKSINESDRSIKLEFPSVTSIIGDILAKKQLLRWEARTSLDIVAGAMSQLDAADLMVPDEDGFCPWDYLTDADTLIEWLAEHELTSKAIAMEAAARGKAAHKYFENAANAFLEGVTDVDEREGHDRAKEYFTTNQPGNPFEEAIYDWWLTRLPVVVSSEKLLVSKRHDFAGTCDLFWLDDGVLTVTDLKTRKAGNGSYDSDHIQTGAYAIAYEEMTGQRAEQRTVLLAQDDGTWDEPESWIDPTTFLHLRAVYAALEERK
jgi:SHS2 domain-containing protein